MDPRRQLEELKDYLHNRIQRDNDTLKHVILAIGEIDRPIPPDPDDIPPLEPDDEVLKSPPPGPKETSIGRLTKPPQTSQEKQQARISNKTPFKNLTLKTSIMVVLKSGPITSRDVTDKLIKRGWQTDSKNPLMSVRACLSRMRHEIKHEKINGVIHYSLLPLKDLM